jgi:hypothetical protein
MSSKTCCRTETADPRICLDAGKAVTSCSLEFFKKIKVTGAYVLGIIPPPSPLDDISGKTWKMSKFIWKG